MSSSYNAIKDIQLDTPPNSVHPDEGQASPPLPPDDSCDSVTNTEDLTLGSDSSSGLDRRSSFGSSSEESDNHGLYDEVVATDAETEDDNDPRGDGSDDENTTIVFFRDGTNEAELQFSASSKFPLVEYRSNLSNEESNIANQNSFPVERDQSFLISESHVEMESIDDIETQKIDFSFMCNTERHPETTSENCQLESLNLSAIVSNTGEAQGSHDSTRQDCNNLESVDTQLTDVKSSQILFTENETSYLNDQLQVNLVVHEGVGEMSIAYPTPDVSPCAQSLNDEKQDLTKDTEDFHFGAPLEASQAVNEILEASQTVNKILEASQTGKEILEASQTVNEILEASQTVNKTLEASQTGKEILEASQTGKEILEASQTGKEILEASQTGKEILEARQTGKEILEASQTGKEILEASQTGTGKEILEASQTVNEILETTRTVTEILEGSDTELNVIVPTDGLTFDDLQAIDGITKIVGRPIIHHVIESRQKMDTVLTLADGKLGAHRMVLCAASMFLEELLIEQDAKSKATLILPEISKKTMELILMLSYTGKVVYSKDEEEDFYSAMKMLLVGQTADMTLLQLPPPPKPEPQPPAQKEDDLDMNLTTNAPRDAVFEEVTHEQVEFSASGSSDLPSCSSATTKFQCELCSRCLVDSSTLQYHLDNTHKIKKEMANFNEIRVVSFCHGCNTQYKTLDRAQKCLTSHGLLRCWICFEVYTKAVIRSHYMTNHCDESSIQDAHNTFIRCRWCPRRVNVTMSVTKLSSHCLTHVPQNQYAKGRRSRSSGVMVEEDDEDDGVVFEESKTVDGKTLYLRYKTLKGEDTNAMEERFAPLTSSEQSSPPTYEASENNKCNLNLAKLPFMNIQLNRLPQFIEDKIFRRASLQFNPTVSSKSASESTVSTLLNQHPTLLYEIENNKRHANPAVSTGGAENEKSEKKYQRPFGIQQKSKESLHSIHDQALEDTGIEKLVTPLRLFTHTLGHVNLLAQNLSKHHFTGFPENPILIIGSFSAADIWAHIEGMKSKDMEVVILRLIPSTQSESSVYTSLYDNLNSVNRIGIISGLGITQTEIFLCAFTEENRNRALQLAGNPDYEDKATDSLFAVAIPVQLQPTSSPKSNEEKQKGKGQKRPFESPQFQPMMSSGTSAGALILRRGRKRLKVVKDSESSEVEDVSNSEVANSHAAQNDSLSSDVHHIVASISEFEMPRLSDIVTTAPSEADKWGEHRKRKERQGLNRLGIVKYLNLPTVTPILEAKNVEEARSEDRKQKNNIKLAANSSEPTATPIIETKNMEEVQSEGRKKNKVLLEAVNSSDTPTATSVLVTENVEDVRSERKKKKRIQLEVNPSSPAAVETENVEEVRSERKKKKRIQLEVNPSSPAAVETENVEEVRNEKRKKKKLIFAVVTSSDSPTAEVESVEAGQSEKRKKKKKIELEVTHSSDPSLEPATTEPENIEKFRNLKRQRNVAFTGGMSTNTPTSTPSDHELVEIFLGPAGESPLGIEIIDDEISGRKHKKKKKKSSRASSRCRKGYKDVEDTEFNTLLSHSIERMSISSDDGEEDENTEKDDGSPESDVISASSPAKNETEKRKVDWNVKLMESERNKKTRWKQTKLNLTTTIMTRSSAVPKPRRDSN